MVRYHDSFLSDMFAFFTVSAALIARANAALSNRATMAVVRRRVVKAAGMFAALDAVAKAGVCFEVLTAFLSVLDVIADAFVCREFYANGHSGWAALVLLSLLASTCLYTTTGADVLSAHTVLSRSDVTAGWSRRRWCFAVLPVAQLMPTIIWAMTSLHEAGLIWPDQAAAPPPRNTGSWSNADAAISGTAPVPTVTSAVVREQCAEVSFEFAAMRRVHEEIDAYVRKHMFFFLETVVEAIPQAVIQLLAMTSIGEDPSPLQLFSMAMSLLTIATKLYLVCLTFDLKMFAFKVCLAVMDLFAFFYVFATLLAPRHEDSPTFRPFWLPWGLGFAGAVWVGRSVFLVGLLASVLVGVLLPIIAYERYANGRNNFSWRRVLEVALGAGVAAAMAAPVFFVLDALKLGWFIALDTLNLGDAADFPQRGVQVAFIRSGKTFREQNRRLLAILRSSMALWEPSPIGDIADSAHASLTAETAAIRRADASASDRGHPTLRSSLSSLKREVKAAVTPFPLRMLFCTCNTPHGYFSEMFAVARSFLMENYNNGRFDNMLIPLAAVSVMVPYFITQALLLPLPLVNYIVEEGFTFSPAHQNGFQLFCLAVWCAAAIGALLLFPAAVPYIRYILAMHTLVNRVGVRPGPMDHLLAFMARTLMPEPGDVLRHTVAPSVLPAVVRDYVVAPYATLRLTHLSAAECAALRK